MEAQRQELLEELMTWHHRMFQELLAQHLKLVEAHIHVSGVHPFTHRECRSVNQQNFEEIINPSISSDNMVISDFMVDLCDQYVGDDGCCSYEQFCRVLDAIHMRHMTDQITMGDKVRTCYIIDRSLHSKRVTESEVRKLTEYYQSKIRIFLDWLLHSASMASERLCVTLLLRLLLSLPPRDTSMQRDLFNALTTRMPPLDGTNGELAGQLVAFLRQASI
ncbi:unnamed protein product [Aphanomyces euteiches]